MLIDTHEPRTIGSLILQVFPDSKYENINQQGFADYVYQDYRGAYEQIERKQVGEVLTDIASIEYQLRKHLDYIRETILLVEGVMLPGAKGIHTFVLSDNGRIMRPGRVYEHQSYNRIEAWLWGLEQAGVTVWRTSGWEASASAIAMRAKHVLNPNHTTLARHLKQLPVFSINPHVQALMGLSDAYKLRIGPDKAEALINQFWSLGKLLATPADIIADMVPGIGLATATKLREVLSNG